MKLKPFGHGGSAIEHGDLQHHIGWIEALALDEEDNLPVSGRGAKTKRWERVHDALEILREVEGLSA